MFILLTATISVIGTALYVKDLGRVIDSLEREHDRPK
jgi:hypothetical protein